MSRRGHISHVKKAGVVVVVVIVVVAVAVDVRDEMRTSRIPD